MYYLHTYKNYGTLKLIYNFNGFTLHEQQKYTTCIITHLLLKAEEEIETESIELVTSA